MRPLTRVSTNIVEELRDMLKEPRSREALLAGDDAFVQRFVDSGSGDLWTNRPFASDITARLGDYGYISRGSDGEAFVKLGHIDDVLPNVKVTIHTFARSRNHKVTTPWRRVLRWPDEVSR